MRVGILPTARLRFTTLTLTLCNKVEVTQFCNCSSSSLLAYTLHQMLQHTFISNLQQLWVLMGGRLNKYKVTEQISNRQTKQLFYKLNLRLSTSNGKGIHHIETIVHIFPKFFLSIIYIQSQNCQSIYFATLGRTKYFLIYNFLNSV